eukprot:TRINITY_DN29529_c0_g1_i1.p1 TRINITY_DN29529_c0_g1~~TRINITY_DN29529_c0_g1_i1.p1  ORF type:complete len:205 (+),score=69.04 TRINITY_DN29529_c0_g1_i1:56-670(+)
MATENQEKQWIKVALMGGGGVGKSNITLMFISGKFQDNYDPTIEDSYSKDNFMVDDEASPIEIYDTAGQDGFVGMRDRYYRDMDGFVFVYSIIDKGSLADVEDRFDNVKRVRDTEGTGKLPPIIVVGNKSDLEDERVISKEEGEAMTREYGSEVLFLEASAKGNINIEEIFQNIVREIRKAKSEAGTEAKGKKKKKKKGGCMIV